jgi:RNase P subunit RPR2
MKSYRTELQACLDCGTLLDTATSAVHKHKPQPGMITICINCGHIMAFTTGLKFRKLTDEEIHMVAGDKKILAIQKARAKIQKHKQES